MPPPCQSPCPIPFTQAPTPPPCPFTLVLSFNLKPLPHPLAFDYLVVLGLLTSLNLNILTIWVRDPWVSIQIHFWGCLPPRKEVPHMCKIVNIFNRQFILGHFVALGPLTFLNLNISTIWVRDPWVSIQINFLVSLPPRKEVPDTCKIVNYF